MNMASRQKKVFAHSPRQKRYNCEKGLASALIEGKEYTIENFSKYGLAITVPQDRRSFPAQFEITILQNGRSVLNTIGTFRHRKVTETQRELAYLGISVADEVPIESLIAATESHRLANKVQAEIENLQQILPQFRECLDQIFLTFTETASNISKISANYAELTLPERAGLRAAFTTFAQVDTSNTLKKIGSAIETQFATAPPQQRELFVRTLRRRIRVFFEKVSFVTESEEFPFLYPGHTDLIELKRNQRFDVEDLLSSLVSSLILESKSIDSRIQLEIKIAEELGNEFKTHLKGSRSKVASCNILFLCAGSGQILDRFFADESPLSFSKLQLKFVDFLERPLLRNQAKLQKIFASSGSVAQATFEQHLAGAAANTPFDDLIMAYDFKQLAETQDIVVVPWLADYIDSAMRLAMYMKLHGILKPGGLVIVGKTPPPRPMFDIMPLLFDWNIEYISRSDFVTSVPTGFDHNGAAIEANSSRSWVLQMRKNY